MTDIISGQPSCADTDASSALTVAEARAAIGERVGRITDQEKVAVRDALGRVLAEACVSPVDVPGHTNSAMDGYAFAGADLPGEGTAEFEVSGAVLAGGSTEGAFRPGCCVRIMTGAPMPPGTDTVVMQEQVEQLRPQFVRVDGRHRTGQNVRQAGEDIARGARVFEPGRRITAADVGVLASLGFAELKVYRRPRVAFFSTGDELRALGEPLRAGEVYDSNRYSLHALLRQAGADLIDLGVVNDDPARLRDALSMAAGMADVVVTSGGVSVGEADFTRSVLRELGDMDFWTIAMKPGRPLTFGRLDKAVFFGLPGNPVAVMLTFQQFVRPALHRLVTGRWPVDLVIDARVEVALKKKAGRFEFVRGILDVSDDGGHVVRPAGPQGSGVLTSMSRANCFVLLDEGCAGVQAGDWVRVQPFDILL
jgi:molybdopterin molybdotransferase